MAWCIKQSSAANAQVFFRYNLAQDAWAGYLYAAGAGQQFQIPIFCYKVFKAGVLILHLQITDCL